MREPGVNGSCGAALLKVAPAHGRCGSNAYTEVYRTSRGAALLTIVRRAAVRMLDPSAADGHGGQNLTNGHSSTPIGLRRGRVVGDGSGTPSSPIPLSSSPFDDPRWAGGAGGGETAAAALMAALADGLGFEKALAERVLGPATPEPSDPDASVDAMGSPLDPDLPDWKLVLGQVRSLLRAALSLSVLWLTPSALLLALHTESYVLCCVCVSRRAC